jgi:hypothetical protein
MVGKLLNKRCKGYMLKSWDLKKYGEWNELI